MASSSYLSHATAHRAVHCAERAAQSTLNCFTALTPLPQVVARAQSAHRRRQQGQPLSLIDGLPVSLKDAFCTQSLPTSAGSRMLQGYQSPFDATVVQRLLSAGAIIIGKNNMDEFAMGSSNIHSVWGPALNPLDPLRTPGGSSGGTAAAVASGCSLVGLGTDTGGSVRQPAAMCGILGFKPSYGAISRYGVVAMSSSLDTVGLLAGHLDDLEAVFNVIRGSDDFDSTADETGLVGAGRQFDPSRLRVGVSSDFYPEEMDSEVVAVWERTAKLLGWDGVADIRINHVPECLPTYYVISTAESSSNLARYDGLRYGFRADHDSLQSLYENTRKQGFGEEVQRRIRMGNFVLEQAHSDEFFLQAQRVRRLVVQEFERAFEQCDILVVPTVAQLKPPLISEIQSSQDPLDEWVSDLLTVPMSLAGLPTISLPVGMSREGFPVSMQLIGRRFDDDLVLSAARMLQERL